MLRMETSAVTKLEEGSRFKEASHQPTMGFSKDFRHFFASRPIDASSVLLYNIGWRIFRAQLFGKLGTPWKALLILRVGVPSGPVVGVG